ncbi:MAG: TVP38/TMEM64 family protein [Bilifractor sp.]|jgi:uncharacterized membrane protein YdjX (TVP38/TMEM64 family)
MEQRRNRSVRNIIAIAGLIICLIGCCWLWKGGYLSSRQKIEQSLQQFGILAPLVFIALQAVQVVIPIMPGGISCLVGVLMFGAWKGFLYNYIGICIGSVLAFLLARKCGMPLIRKLFSEKLFERYQKWTNENNRFTRLFAIAIFLPVAPDDFLCFLAGTTTMPLKVFTWIILLGKPGAIALYSLGLTGIFNRIFPALAG